MANPFLSDINNFTNVDNIKVSSVDDKSFVPTNSTTDDLSGVLDIMLRTITVNLDAQKKSGRVRQEDYASAYVALCQTAIQTIMQYFLQRDKVLAEIEMINKQIELLDKQVEKEAEQIETYKRQRKAYDEDYMIKALSSIIDPYIAFLTSMPNVDTQVYPSMFVSNSNAPDDTPANEPNGKLRFIDGLMNRIYTRVNEYASAQTTLPTKPT